MALALLEAPEGILKVFGCLRECLDTALECLVCRGPSTA